MTGKQLPENFEARKLLQVPVKPNEELISRIEWLLEQAKSGELLGIAWLGQWRGDQVSSSWCLSDMNARRIIGEIEFLKRDLMSSVE